MHIGPADSAQAVIGHCRKIATFTDEPGVTTRTFLGPAMRDCLAYFQAWAIRIGMRTWIDAAGNFRAVSSAAAGKRLVIGSHLDSVPHAGAFDGVLGVVLGMTLAESLPEKPLEIVGFSEEEGVRFKRPFIGSTAFVSGLDDDFLGLTDSNGITVMQAVNDPLKIRVAQMEAADAYLEFHIEQGPVLESLGLSLAIVDAIAGQTRATFEFTGHANHAGTTPMNLRQDAFSAAAEWTLLVEQTALAHSGMVATVGSVRVAPDSANTIVGKATLSLDLRHAKDGIRAKVFGHLVAEAQAMAHRRNVAVQSAVRLNQSAVPMDAHLIEQLEKAIPNAQHLVSGAGHDAMILAPKIPSAMIFLRSPGGISHHPDENVLCEDVEAALNAGRTFVQNFC